jgi:hypothetical protein
MKKSLFVVLGLMAYCSLQAQSLTGTAWNLSPKSNPGNPVVGIVFTQDTLYLDTFSGSLEAFSVYSLNDSLFTTIDFSPNSACSATDTGRYVASFNGDTLAFTLVSDPGCPTRRSNYLDFYWIQRNVGLPENENFTFDFYPNPSKGDLNINLQPELIGASLKVFNAQGQLVQSEIMETTHDHLDLSDLEGGVYFLRIGNSEVQRIVLQP